MAAQRVHIADLAARARDDGFLARADHHRRRRGDVRADDAVQRGFGGHGDDALDRARIDFLAADDAVVEAGQHVARAAGGLRLSLDHDLVASCADIDAQAILDRDQVAVIFAEQLAEQLGPVEDDLQTGAVAGLGGDGFAAHAAPSIGLGLLRVTHRNGGSPTMFSMFMSGAVRAAPMNGGEGARFRKA